MTDDVGSITTVIATLEDAPNCEQVDGTGNKDTCSVSIENDPIENSDLNSCDLALEDNFASVKGLAENSHELCTENTMVRSASTCTTLIDLTVDSIDQNNLNSDEESDLICKTSDNEAVVVDTIVQNDESNSASTEPCQNGKAFKTSSEVKLAGKVNSFEENKSDDLKSSECAHVELEEKTIETDACQEPSKFSPADASLAETQVTTYASVVKFGGSGIKFSQCASLNDDTFYIETSSLNTFSTMVSCCRSLPDSTTIPNEFPTDNIDYVALSAIKSYFCKYAKDKNSDVKEVIVRSNRIGRYLDSIACDTASANKNCSTVYKGVKEEYGGLLPFLEKHKDIFRINLH